MADETRCKEMLPPKGGPWGRLPQCPRKAVRDGFCAQHHPDAKAARWNKSREAWRVKQAEYAKQRQIASAKEAVIEAAEALRDSDWTNEPVAAIERAVDALREARK